MQLRGKGFDTAGDEINCWEHWNVDNSPHIAICLSQPSDSRAQWRITVVTKNDEGDFEVGTILTRSPVAGDPANRVVAEAYVPGTRHWTVIVQGPQGETAELVISAQKDCCGGGAVAGVVPINGSFLEGFVWQTPFFVAAVQGALGPVGASTLMRAYGWSDPAFPAGNFVGFVDKAAPIVNGDPFVVLPIPIFPGQIFAFDFEDEAPNQSGGIRFANQIRFCVSGTANVVTLAVAGVSMQAERV